MYLQQVMNTFFCSSAKTEFKTQLKSRPHQLTTMLMYKHPTDVSEGI